MLTFLAGFGITLLLVFMTFAVIVSCAGIIALIRAALNGDLSSGSKIFWILASFVPGCAFLYFAFIDRNRLLKFVGWFCIIAFTLAAVLGGSTFRSAFSPENGWRYEQKIYKNSPENNWNSTPGFNGGNNDENNGDKLPGDAPAPDDSGVTL